MPRTAFSMRASSAAWWLMSGGSGLLSVTPIFVLDALLVGLVDRALFAAALREGDGGGIAFVAQLAIRQVARFFQRAVLDRRADRAAGFVAVAAVAEAAIGGERLDILETTIGEILLAAELELAHARRVDQATALRQRDQHAIGGGVAAALVVRTHFLGFHPVDAEQGVGERGFAGAG